MTSPERHIDQVDFNRASAPAYILQTLLCGPAAELVREQVQAWHRESWSSGGPLIEPRDLDTIEGVRQELIFVIEGVMQPLAEGAHHVEVGPDCVAWRRRSEPPPRVSEEVFCESCRAVHQIAGYSMDGLDTTLSTPVLCHAPDDDADEDA